jgi:hypothetical protein
MCAIAKALTTPEAITSPANSSGLAVIALSRATSTAALHTQM